LTDFPLAGMRILVIEDEPLIAMDIEELCREHGATTVSCIRSNEEARTLDLTVVDAAIVDLIVVDGSTVAAATLLREANVPFIFSSGHTRPGDLRDFSDIPRIDKPFSGAALIDLLAATIQGGKASRRP